MSKNTPFHFNIFIYTNKEKVMEDKKLKRKINISINKDVLSKIENLTTNKSRLIEYVLIEYLHKSNIKTDDIIL
jgi:hypothetical protein